MRVTAAVVNYETTFNDREVKVKEIDWAKDPTETDILDAVYLDTGKELTEEELADLAESEMDHLYEMWQDRYGRGGEDEGHWRD